MRQLLQADGADPVRGHRRRARPVPAGPDGGQRAHQLRAPQERPPGHRADPPGAEGGAGADPRHHLPPARLPGADHGHRPGAGRLHPRRRRPAAPGHGQEEEGGPGRRVRASSTPACAATATPTRRSRRCGTSCCRSPVTRSTSRTPPATAWSSYWTAYLKANYPAEYMAALLTSVGDDKDKMAVYLAECRKMGIKVLPPDVNESAARLRRRRRRQSASASARSATSARTSSTAIVKARKEKGRYTDFDDFLDKVAAGRLQQAGHRVADQGGRVRLARPPAQGPAR